MWLKRHQHNVLATLGGVAITLSLAPLSWWPLAFVGPALIYWALNHCSRAQGFQVGWWSGLGLFLSGTSWVYVSIHYHSDTPAIIAALMTCIFCGGLALLHGFLGWFFVRYFRHIGFTVWSFSALWVVMDAIRGVILTGFPWLYIGHGYSDSPLAYLLPLIGVSGATFATLLFATNLTKLFTSQRRGRLKHGAHLLAILLLVGAAQFVPSQTQQLGTSPLSIGIAQGNIAQEDKWKPENVRSTISTYLHLTESLWGSDIIVWPESAVTLDYLHASDFLGTLADIATESHGSLITGIPYASKDWQQIHNSITAVGNGSGLYHKQKLVPFGEYVPLQSLVRGTLAFFDLPMSSFTPGPAGQDLLRAGQYTIAPFICYEIAYSEFVRQNLKDANFIVTISNDAWFGSSWAPWQHQQIAQTRALETGRYILRATNNGVSSIIDPSGNITQSSQQFIATAIKGAAWPIQGETIFLRLGNTPLYVLCLLILIALILNLRHAERNVASQP